MISPQFQHQKKYLGECGIVDNLYDSGVKSVFIAEILTRSDFTKCPGLTKKQRFSVNKKLAENTNKNEYLTNLHVFI